MEFALEQGSGLSLRRSKVVASPWCSSQAAYQQFARRLTLLARCYSYRFSFDADGRLKMEAAGACGEQKNTELLEGVRAKAFTQHSPAQAVKLMCLQGIQEEEIPEKQQVKNMRCKFLSTR